MLYTFQMLTLELKTGKYNKNMIKSVCETKIPRVIYMHFLLLERKNYVLV